MIVKPKFKIFKRFFFSQSSNSVEVDDDDWQLQLAFALSLEDSHNSSGPQQKQYPKTNLQSPKTNLQSPKTNLHVRNFGKNVDDVSLRNLFAPFGAVVSAKVEMSNGESKGFGYVSFEHEHEAERAIR
jgi:RNA recognition motif-containing protein